MRELTSKEKKLVINELVNEITRSVVLAKNYESKICNDDKQAIMEIVSILKNEIFKDNKYLKITYHDPNTRRYESIENFLYIVKVSIPHYDNYQMYDVYKEIELSYKRLFEWKNSINKNSGLKVEDTAKKLQEENKRLKQEIEYLLETQKIKQEVEYLKQEIEYLKNKLPKRKSFSIPQIQSIKNMSTNGISTRLIAMEFNCEIEDIQNIIDNI